MEHRELADWLLECIIERDQRKLSKRVRTYIRAWWLINMTAY